jgi:lipid II:glycine glycyltransferase (peptidoglycan interpeptide bridge formation enzyme)
VNSLRARLGLRAARFDVQHRNSWVVDLAADEQATLAALPPSTRRNIRIASRAEVTVTADSSRSAVEGFYRLHLDTVRRQRFTTRPQSYYEAALTDLDGVIFVASRRGQPLAAAMAISCGPRLIYLYGGTSLTAPEARASYALHWEMIRWGIQQGCSFYDMWGVPRHFDPANSAHGYATFKTRWGGRQVSHSGLLLAPLWGPADPALHQLEAWLLRRRPLLT